jgi:hypothetical protein
MLSVLRSGICTPPTKLLLMYIVGEYPCSSWIPWPQLVCVICASVTVQRGGFDEVCVVVDLLIKMVGK